MRHEWFFFPHNPMVLHSEPPGFLIFKHRPSDQPKYYALHNDNDGSVKPLMRAAEWDTLAAHADRITADE